MSYSAGSVERCGSKADRRFSNLAYFVALMAIVFRFASAHGESGDVSISGDRLKLTLSVPDGTCTVVDQASGIRWRQYLPTHVAQGRKWRQVVRRPVPSSERVRIIRAEVDGDAIVARAIWRRHPFRITIAVDRKRPIATVSIDTDRPQDRLPWQPDWAGIMLMSYPYPFWSPSAGDESVVPIDEGLLFRTDMVDPNRDPKRWAAWWLHQKLSMPWWGVTDGRRGVMTLVDTPFDAMFSIQWVQTEQGPRTLPQVTWVASKGRWGYTRRVIYHFFSAGGHVAMAKSFRRRQIARGRFRSWQEKTRENPNVARLLGALDLWSQSEITADMIRAIRSAGIRRAVVAKSRGGAPKPGQGIDNDALRLALDAGYVIGGYHNYSWIQGRWIEQDPSLRDAAIVQADGTHKTIANPWDPKGRLDRCPAAHRPTFVDIGKSTRKLGINYFFTDCTTTGGVLQECYGAQHPVTRSEGAQALHRSLSALKQLGFIVGSERGKWWATQSTDIFEGIETLIEYGGPFYGSGDATHWVGPYRKDRPGYETLFLGYDFNPARRVPLFQLVYHDSVYCTRRWNQDAGRDRSLWNRHDLMNILYGTPALWFMHPKAGNVIGTEAWNRHRDRYMKSYRDVCGWHETIGFDEMTEHRFLSSDRLVQETHFSSGWGVVVNFSQHSWRDPRGFVVPPEAFHRLAPVSTRGDNVIKKR